MCVAVRGRERQVTESVGELVRQAGDLTVTHSLTLTMNDDDDNDDDNQ